MVLYKAIYTLTEAAQLLCISENELWDLLITGRLTYIMVGEHKLIRGIDMESYINHLTGL